MIKTLTGKVDGNDVIFRLGEQGQWSCVVPATSTGRYTVELYAEDEAGNSLYYATVLFTIDLTTMTVSITMLQINTELMDFNFLLDVSDVISADLIDDRIDAELMDNEIDTYLLDPEYSIELISNIRC